MSQTPADNYNVYYADKLWTLLPEVYRALDTVELGGTGPLREMVNRIGVTAGALRRSIDRLWDNQSIETCDDWVIPYIADLLDTRLVLGLDPSRQRLDVANTISYRLRKGTLGVVEQVASDLTGWDAKVVEFFRRLGRTRHGLDPPIIPISAIDGQITKSQVVQLQRAEGLVGALTKTQIGGFADLRNVYGAGKSRTAFDELFHTADTRMGQGMFGWHAIPHLGVFVWRLLSLAVGPVTPVAVQGCPGWYCFDPTGRDIPLFAARRGAGSFGDVWVSPSEGQLPTPISQKLLDADIKLGADGLGLYPVEPPPRPPMSQQPVMSVALAAWPDSPLPASGSMSSPLVEGVVLRPTRGRFRYAASPPPSLIARYCYGFPSEIGAGPYDRRGQATNVPNPDPRLPKLTGGGNQLATNPLPGAGTVVLGDSLTYDGAADVTVTGALTLQAGSAERPLLRLDQKDWVITGTTNCTLVLDGIFVSGGQDIILRGNFSAVTLTCCTLDPGSAAASGVFANPGGSPPAGLFQMSADGRDLRPTRLWIEGTIATLTIDRCVLGPIRTRDAGNVETTSITNTTLQAIRMAALGAIAASEVRDVARLERQLQLGLDAVSAFLRKLAPDIGSSLGPVASPPIETPVPPLSQLPRILMDLNGLIAGPAFDQKPDFAAAFANVPLSAETQRLLHEAARPPAALNRLLLEDAYPLELADAALAFADGTLNLSRCTVMGRVVAHRLEASECILQELAQTDDLQHGCVRFSAWASGSVVPRQYESVGIPQSAPLFTSTVFGEPGYAQLLPTADLQRLPPDSPSTTPQNTISSGAVDGSEMGAYARDKNPIRARALVVKLEEYMPANLVPVIVNVT